MGGTIPLLTQALSRDVEDSTRLHAQVYGFNTVGAFAGALCAVFLLIPWMGLSGTVVAMAAINAVAGATFVALGLKADDRSREEHPASAAAPLTGSEETNPSTRWTRSHAAWLTVALLSGFAMMTIQTTVNRIGGLALGASHFTFAMVVAVFVLCLAIGSFGVSLLPRIPKTALPLSQWLLVGYLALLLRDARSERHEPKVREDSGSALAVTGQFLFGIVLVVVSAELLVEAASSIAHSLGVSEWVIGITIVAAGTSLPEFTTSLVAVVRGQHDLSLGNIIGSDIFNVLGVLGLTALLRPVPIGPEASGSILALAGMVCITLIFMRTGWRISRIEGSALIACGILRWMLDFSG